MTDTALWTILTLLCDGSHCEVYAREPETFASFAACEQSNMRGHNFSDIVPPHADIRWECMPTTGGSRNATSGSPLADVEWPDAGGPDDVP